jgi:hypothetical protein
MSQGDAGTYDENSEDGISDSQPRGKDGNTDESAGSELVGA